MHNTHCAFRIAERFVITDRGRLVERIEKTAVTCDSLIERMAMIAARAKTA